MATTIAGNVALPAGENASLFYDFCHYHFGNLSLPSKQTPL
jgi:hypothetical protein